MTSIITQFNIILVMILLAPLVYGLHPGVACWDHTDGPPQCGLGFENNTRVMNTILGEVLEGLWSIVDGTQNFPNNQPIVCTATNAPDEFNCLSLQNTLGAPYSTISSLTQLLVDDCVNVKAEAAACGGAAVFEPQNGTPTYYYNLLLPSWSSWLSDSFCS
jgi:hypothetical protein